VSSSLGGIAVTLKPSARARVMRLRVDSRTGAVTLSYPKRVSQRKALDWAATKQAWIEAAVNAVPATLALEPGAIVPLEGEPHRIEWSDGRSRTIRAEGAVIVAAGPLDTLETRLLRWLRRHALAVLSRETAEFAAKAGVGVTRVAVGDPMARWGSCSSAGAIRYSWRLILAPAWVRRATVAHEVAHRIHMNHAPDFHRLVETLLGTDPAPARTWLKRHGAELHRIGRR